MFYRYRRGWLAHVILIVDLTFVVKSIGKVLDVR